MPWPQGYLTPTLTPQQQPQYPGWADCAGLAAQTPLSDHPQPPPHHTEHPSPILPTARLSDHPALLPPPRKECHRKARLTDLVRELHSPHLAAGGLPRHSRPPAHR